MRNLSKMQKTYTGPRTILESIMVPEITKAYKDWVKHDKTGVIIGGVALSYYATPRHTTDVDVLFLTANDIPQWAPEGFKKHRRGAFEHKQTGVEIEVNSPESFGGNVPQELVNEVIANSLNIEGARIASKSGLIALKLKRLTWQDKADIIALFNSNRGGDVDLSIYSLTDKDLNNFELLKNEK